jgi:hypothetical protein
VGIDELRVEEEEKIPIVADEKTVSKMQKEQANRTATDIAIKESKVQQISGSFWGIDFGLHNVVCAAHSENLHPPVVVTRKQFNKNVGVSTKSFIQEKDFKTKNESDPLFKAAVSSRCSLTLKNSNVDELKAAVIARIGNFDTLYSFYGQDKYAKDRYFNRNNQDREFARIVKLLFVGDVTNLVCGNATMPNGLKGSQSSLNAKFCAYVERVKGKGTVIFCTEHRTSILDSNTRKVMYRPELPLSKKKLEKRKKWKEKLAGQTDKSWCY